MSTLTLIGFLLLVGLSCVLLLLFLRAETRCQQLQRKLRESADAKENADHSLALSRLAGTVAHDLNNLLTVIAGNAEMLASEAKDSDSRDDAKAILESSTKAAELTRRLLAFSRPGQLVTVPINLNVIITSIHQLLEEIAGEDVNLQILPAPELAPVNADPASIERQLIELVAYCQSRSRPGSKVRLQTYPLSIHPSGGLFDEHGIAVGDYVVVEIADQGQLPEDIDALFQPEGSDVTATIAHTVFEIGGRVFAEAAGPTRGLRIRLLFPALSTPTDVPGTAPSIQRGHGTVLIAEDSDQLRDYVHRALANLGYDVFSARGSEEAVFLYRRHAERVDLLVTDVMMPIETGAELYNRLHAMNPKLPVLFISGYSADYLEDQLRLPEDAPLLTKPFTVEQLAQKVHELIRK
jgi:CheY-like chemotaxis protein